MIGGFSAGAYCAIWTALRTPETYGAAASLSGYDTQIEGQMTNQGDQYLADNTLSIMLANRTPDGMRIYAMAAGDDAVGGAYTALKMASAVKEPDTVTTDVPPTGGHAGPLWREHIPTMLAWWGSSDRVARAVGAASTAATAQSSEASSSIVPVTTVTHEVRPTAPNGYLCSSHSYSRGLSRRTGSCAVTTTSANRPTTIRTGRVTAHNARVSLPLCRGPCSRYSDTWRV